MDHFDPNVSPQRSRMRPSFPLLMLTFAFVLAGGCKDAPRPQQVDINNFRFPEPSDGVVYEVSNQDLENAPVWGVQTTILTIGNVGDSVVFERLTYALRLPDGRFAGADGTGAHILIFDQEGTHITTWGRTGAGPGEFQYPLWLGLCGGAGLHVYDVLMNALTRYDPTGEVRDVERLAATVGPLRGAPACDTEGNLAVVGQIERPQDLREGPFRPLVTISARRVGEEEFRDVVQIPGADSYRWSEQVGPLGDFGRSPRFAVDDGGVFVTTGDAFEIAEYSIEGDFLTLIRANDVKRAPVTEDDLARVRRQQLEASPPQFEARLAQTLDSMQWPAFHPAVDDLVVDAAGCLWVRQVQPMHRNAIWRVLTPQGVPIGVVELPKAFSVTQVDNQEILGYFPRPAEEGRIAVYEYDRVGRGQC